MPRWPISHVLHETGGQLLPICETNPALPRPKIVPYGPKMTMKPGQQKIMYNTYIYTYIYIQILK